MCLLEGKKVMKKATPQTDKGFIRIATGNSENDILMALAGAKLGGTEISIILCIIRKTWGWSKKEDWISLTQFEKYTKRSRQTIVNAINQLVKKNILVKKTIPGIKTVYGFNKNFSSWEHQLVKKTVPVQKTSTTSKENCTGLVKKTIPTKDTITKETIQKKYISIYELNDIHFREIAEKYGVPISFVRSKYEDMINWHESTGKKRKDWVATLRGFVKKGIIERLDNAKKTNYKTAIDASGL